jgi:hypothetical protein
MDVDDLADAVSLTGRLGQVKQRAARMQCNGTRGSCPGIRCATSGVPPLREASRVARCRRRFSIDATWSYRPGCTLSLAWRPLDSRQAIQFHGVSEFPARADWTVDRSSPLWPPYVTTPPGYGRPVPFPVNETD